MIITNNLGLPAPLVKAVTPPPREFVPFRLSVTTLTQPPQIQGLVRQHEGELTEDASDRLWALMGQLLHDVLEDHARDLKDTIAEEKLEIKIGEWTIVGKYDLSEIIIEGEKLTDWKFSTIYALKDDEIKPEWESQINCYIEILRQHGRIITEAQIVVIGRDWSKMRASRESDYPQKAVSLKEVPIWSQEKIRTYLRKRIELTEAAQDGFWSECTDEERWARPAVWAITKKGNKKASKLCYSEQSAKDWFASLKEPHLYQIDYRRGESIRCQHYCPVSKWCPQWAKLNSTT